MLQSHALGYSEMSSEFYDFNCKSTTFLAKDYLDDDHI